jgi:hypothetical protein
VDEDRAAVLKMFSLIKQEVDSLDAKFQVLITEHADPGEAWFKQPSSKSGVMRKRLIPKEWLEPAHPLSAT